MQLPSALFGLIPQSFLCFFLKRPALEKFFIYSQKSFSNFQKLELSYIFLKKKNVFLTFQERYIQNPSIFRTPAKPPKNSVSSKETSYISKDVLYFGESNFLVPSLKHFLYSRRELGKL